MAKVATSPRVGQSFYLTRGWTCFRGKLREESYAKIFACTPSVLIMYVCAVFPPCFIRTGLDHFPVAKGILVMVLNCFHSCPVFPSPYQWH